MAILMGGPGTSIPGAILIARFLGWKKMLIYEALEMSCNLGVAYSFGRLYGDYQCPCLTGVEQHANLEWVAAASGMFAALLIASVLIVWRRSKSPTAGQA
jgi:hypothetical protein